MEYNRKATTTIDDDVIVLTENLRALRVEQSGLSVSSDNDNRVAQNTETTELGHDATQMILTMTKYLNSIEAEKQKLRSEVSRLSKQNEQLLRELAKCKTELRTSEKTVAKLNEQKKDLEEEMQAQRLKRISNPPLEKGDPVPDVIPADKNKASNNTERKSPLYSNGEYDIWTLGSLAILYKTLGRYELAEPLCKLTVSRLQYLNNDYQTLIEMLIIQSRIYSDQNKHDMAVNSLKEVLSVQEKTFGKKDLSVSKTANDIAALYQRQGKYEEAERMFKKALEIRESLLYDDDPMLVMQFLYMAKICEKLGRYREAKEYCQPILELYQDPDNGTVVMANNIIASCRQKQKKLQRKERNVVNN